METSEQDLREVADLLFGDGADELIWKMNPDSADIASKKKRERTQARVGLASNVVGLAAGTAGTAAALRDDRFKEGGKFSRYLHRKAKKIPAPISGKAGKAGAALAGGALALQVGNIGGDIVANRVLARSAKKDIHKRKSSKLTPVFVVASGGAVGGVTGYESRKRKGRVRKDIREIPETGQLPQTKGQITATVAMKGTAKGVETIRAHKGSIKRLQNKVETKRVRKAWDAKKITDAFQAGERAFKAGQGATDVAENIHQTSGSARRTAHHVENIARRADKATAPAAVVGGTAALGGAAGGGYALGRRKKKRGRLIKKSAGPASAGYDVRWEGEFAKVNADKQQVFGWASIVELNGEPVVDLQGDYISIDEVEKSAYEYVHKSRKGGDMHLRDGNQPVIASDMIESFVVTQEKRQALGLPDDTPSGWWVGFQVNDPALWSKVKSGQRTGFSIHGRGVRTPA